MKKENVVVATFNDMDAAEVLSRKLQALGVQATVVDESKLQKYWFWTKPLAFAKVCVPATDAAKMPGMRPLPAVASLLASEVRCPECHSPEIEYPQFTRKFVTTSFAGLFCLLGLLQKKFYCTHCHHSWPASALLRHETDALGFPKPKGPLVGRESL
jgi:hypothetical protein